MFGIYFNFETLNMVPVPRFWYRSHSFVTGHRSYVSYHKKWMSEWFWIKFYDKSFTEETKIVTLLPAIINCILSGYAKRRMSKCSGLLDITNHSQVYFCLVMMWIFEFLPDSTVCITCIHLTWQIQYFSEGSFVWANQLK